MEEPRFIDHRTINSVHEPDRTSHDTLARIYQHLTDLNTVGKDYRQPFYSPHSIATDSAFLQETLP